MLFNCDLQSTNTNIRYDTDIDMSTPRIILENHIIQCNHVLVSCWCQTRHMCDIETRLILTVSMIVLNVTLKTR